MSYRVEFAKSVEGHFRALTARERSTVLGAIERHLLHEPLKETRHRKPLRPNPLLHGSCVWASFECSDKLLTTTRTVRKRLDLTRPVDPEVIQQCLEIAIQAPAGGNVCRYHFVVVTDPTKRAALADLYRKALIGHRSPSRPVQYPNVWESTLHLVEHLHEVPVHILTCVEHTSVWEGENRRAAAMTHILPATWSLMLALRARGIGSAFTTIHTIYYEREAAALLGIPEHIIQAALLPVAYYTGEDFKPAKRVPARERTYWDTWGHTR